MFGPNGPCESSVDLGLLEVYFKSAITDLGFKLDSDLIGQPDKSSGDVQFLSFKATGKSKIFSF